MFLIWSLFGSLCTCEVIYFFHQCAILKKQQQQSSLLIMLQKQLLHYIVNRISGSIGGAVTCEEDLYGVNVH